MELAQDPEAAQTYRLSGMDLADYRQEFTAADGVKVALSCSEPQLNRLVDGKRTDLVRIANIDELFATVAYACSQRSRSSDFLGHYVLLTVHGYTQRMVYDVFEHTEHMLAFNIAQMRLRRCVAVLEDESYACLPSVQGMRLFLAKSWTCWNTLWRAKAGYWRVGADAVFIQAADFT